jgi:hypothetical protein
MMDNMLKCLRMIHAAYDADGADLSAWAGRAADELERLSALVDSEGTRALQYLRRARKAEAEVEALKLGEEGAKEAFGVVVQDKRDLEAESKRRQTLLDAAYADIRRMGQKA